MTSFIPKEKLTAYQRWEVAAFDEAEKAAEAALIEAQREAGRAAEAAAEAQENERIAAELARQNEEPPPVLPTAADIERMHIEAHEQGYAAGYAEGIASAEASAAQIDRLMTSLQQSLKELDQHVADQLLATAVEIANQVLRQSLNIKPELLLPVVKEAISILHPHAGQPALFAHPDDATLIRTHLGDLLAHNNWRIIEDASLSAGGCRVELGASEVDATRETRWRRVIESIGISQDWLDGKP